MDSALLLVGLGLVVAIIAAFTLLARLIEARRTNRDLRNELEPLLESKDRLANAEMDAKRIVDQARSDAERLVVDARTKSDEIVSNAQNEASKTQDNISASLGRITEMRATIAGLKNVIDGYGDQYIVPTQSVLDDLGVHYGFKEAGAALTRARERTRNMITAGATAECDYVEPDRREAAIRFVTDAFVGKTESILAKVKSDNYGKLAQAMKDAFALINTNGRAFRNARVREEFLNVRLSELKWATAVIDLQNKEREEQRAIKEQLREEQRAQKEFERSIKEAEKSEETIKKAIEKAQKDAEKASDEQRAVFEQKLQELTDKLREAEARSQRALSMAQQTRSGHVYIISNVGSFGDDMLKIGMTRRLEPIDRVRELGDASVPFSFDVHAMIFSDDAPRLERDLHLAFVEGQVNKVNPRKEFFRVPLAAIREKIEGMGLGVSWTMLAEAKEHRESLAIEQTLRSKQAHDRWVESQKAAYSAEFETEDGEEGQA